MSDLYGMKIRIIENPYMKSDEIMMVCPPANKSLPAGMSWDDYLKEVVNMMNGDRVVKVKNVE